MTLLGVLARKLELVVLPMASAILITALLHPANRGLRRAGLPRSVAAVATVLAAIAVLGGIGVFVANRASAEYPALVHQVQTLVNNTQSYLKEGPLKLDSKTVDNAGTELVTYLSGSQAQIASGVVSAGRTVLDVVTGLVLTLFLTIFMLYDGEQIWGWISSLWPARNQPKLAMVGDRAWHTLSGYVTGTFIVALFHGVVMGVTLAIVGVPLVAPLAVLVFIGSFIPLLGAVIFGGLAVLVTLVTNGPTTAVVVLVVLVVGNQVESHVLQPFVVGRHVKLHPMAIAVTLASGAVVAGLPGAIFAVPLVASINAAGKALTGREIAPVAQEQTPPDGFGEGTPVGDAPDPAVPSHSSVRGTPGHPQGGP